MIKNDSKNDLIKLKNARKNFLNDLKLNGNTEIKNSLKPRPLMLSSMPPRREETKTISAFASFSRSLWAKASAGYKCPALAPEAMSNFTRFMAQPRIWRH
jgi:hypothetical protein